MRWVGHAARIGLRNAHKIVVEKREGKRLRGRLRCRRRIIFLKKQGADWVHQVHWWAPVNTGCIHIRRGIS